jgi:hypothetical protein
MPFVLQMLLLLGSANCRRQVCIEDIDAVFIT